MGVVLYSSMVFLPVNEHLFLLLIIYLFTHYRQYGNFSNKIKNTQYKCGM